MSADTSVRNRNDSAVRIADTLLRATSGTSATLLVPPSTVDTTDAGQLGLNPANFQMLPIAPVVFRKVRVTLREGRETKYELLVSASAIAASAGASLFNSADGLLSNAAGILVGGTAFQIESWDASESLGEAYLYRLLLRAAEPLSIRVGS